jgi:hypothetical protein
VERDTPFSRKRREFIIVITPTADPIFRFFLPPSSFLPLAAPLAAMDNARLLSSVLDCST